MISRRTRLMAAGLASTTVLWTIDWLTSTKPVKPAAGAQTPGISGLVPTSRPATLDVDALIAQVRAASSQPNSSLPTEAMRNPFAATGALAELEKVRAAAAGIARSNGVPGTSPESTKPAEPALVLHGVITGDQPMAVINSSIVSLHARIDDWRLVEIGRDYVVLRSEEGSHTLRMQLP